MACPMGFTSDNLPTFEKPHIFEEVTEPKELRKIADDAIYLTGGQFAIMCQFAHPALAEGSYKHSNFAGRVMNRLQTTARFLNAAVYGNQEEKEAIFSVIHAAHADVKGDGYYADDPELHKWTAATLYVSLVTVHETFFGKLSRERQEVLYREAAIYGTSLRMPPDMWPETLEDFWVYWDHNIATLEVTDYARSLANDLLWPIKMPLWLRPSLPIARLMTVHWLPERLQREFNLRITPLNKSIFYFVASQVSLIYPYLPRSVRSMPSKIYLKDMKKSVKRIQESGSWHKERK